MNNVLEKYFHKGHYDLKFFSNKKIFKMKQYVKY